MGVKKKNVKPATRVKDKTMVVKVEERTDYKLHLGCGNDLKRGYENLDINDGNIGKEGIVHCDLEVDKLPYKDNSCEEVIAVHLLEHITNLGHVMNEVHRVLKPGGLFNIEVPMYPFPEAFQDPTHVRFFVENSFKYFLKDEGLHENYGKIYGYKTYSWGTINIVNRNLVVRLKK